VTRQIRRVATVFLGLFALLFVNLNVLQLLRADELANNPANRRLLIAEYKVQRGPIVVGGEELARSIPSDGDLAFQREYPQGPAYAHVTGFYSFLLSRSGIEAAMNEELNGGSTELLTQNLSQLLGQQTPKGNVVELTLDPAVQKAAINALGDRTGAVVAMDPRTGAILAHVSRPTYDPTVLTTGEANTAWEELRSDPGRPLLDRATRELFFPGSTFKIVTAAAALERSWDPTTPFEDTDTYQPAVGQPIRNYQDGPCGDGETITLAEAFAVSCNSTFARLGELLSTGDLEGALIAQAESFGFNRELPYELPVERSFIPKALDPAQAAQTGIGQFETKATPLQMAMVVSSIVNEGTLMTPHVVRAVRDPAGRQVRGEDILPWDDGRFGAQAVTPRTARLLRDMMVDVVTSGTGKAAAIQGVTVGGKTGTAQTGREDETATAWFVGFADQDVVVAVVVPDAGGGGGTVAGPIARAVMEAVVRG
jgi:peptidoglycan glycosyltransferase